MFGKEWNPEAWDGECMGQCTKKQTNKQTNKNLNYSDSLTL
jgi:hypothetical protein